MHHKVEIVNESIMSLVGKNLIHCADNNTLMWCDILGGQVFCMDLNNHNKMRMFKILGEKVICFCVPIEGKKDQYIVGAGRRLLLVNWDGMHTMGKIIKVLCDVPVTGVRMNQCRVDKMGRLYFGTMVSEEQSEIFDLQKRIGSIYRFSFKDGLVQMKDNIGLANGMVWNSTYTKMYFTDSYDLNIYEFDFDMKTGNISNQKVFMDVSNHGQMKRIFPSGMTMDDDEHLYLAMFGGGKILKINMKTSKVEIEIKMNVHQITGCEFGGKDMDTMYVVSAGMDFHSPQMYPSGLLMKVTNLGCMGMEMHKMIMN